MASPNPRGTPVKLDAKSIAALKLDGKTDAIHFDDSMAGFGYRLRRGAGGKVLRSWVVQYKRAGATRRITPRLGRGAWRRSRRGRRRRSCWPRSPWAKTRRPHGSIAAARTCSRCGRRPWNISPPRSTSWRSGPSSRCDVTSPIARYFGPLHKLAIDTITRRDVAARVVVIMRECGNPTAARARGALGSFFTWAMRMAGRSSDAAS